MKVTFKKGWQPFDWKAFVAWIIFIGLIVWFILKQVIKVKVDTKKIEWLLKNATQYDIAKNTGVAQPTISNIINGKRALKNLTIEVGSKLTEYAEHLQNHEN